MRFGNILEKKVSKELSDQRQKICDNCQFFKTSTGSCGTLAIKPGAKKKNKVLWKGEERQLCGCVIKVKKQFLFFTCPLDKWPVHDAPKIKEFLETIGSTSINSSKKAKLAKYHNEVFGTKYKYWSNCTDCILAMIENLEKFINEYGKTDKSESSPEENKDSPEEVDIKKEFIEATSRNEQTQSDVRPSKGRQKGKNKIGEKPKVEG